MPLSDIVTVTLTTTNPGVTAAGFGVPMIVTHRPTWAERQRSYSNLAAVLVDFAATTWEYEAAAAIFAQSPCPTSIKIGRGALAPTQKFTITVKTVANSTVYSFNVHYLGVTQTVTYTSDSTALESEIITGLKNALDALAAPAVISGGVFASAAPGGTSLTITATSASGALWCGVEVVDRNLLICAEDNADPGIATDLAAIQSESSDWYGLVLGHKSLAIITAAATWVESNTKLFLAASSDTAIAQTVLSGATDIAAAMKSAARVRTHIDFHPRSWEWMDAASFGRFFPLDPGSETWRMKTLSGVTANATITGTEQTNIAAKYAGYYYTVSGSTAVIGGDAKVAGNEYIDVIRFRDWWVATLGAALANLLIGANKVPYTDAGIAAVEKLVRATNDEGISKGGIAPSPAPVVSVPKASACSTADKTSRTLNNVLTTWYLAGAIHQIAVSAVVSV